MKQDHHLMSAHVTVRLPPHNAGASLKRHPLFLDDARKRGLPPHNAGASLKLVLRLAASHQLPVFPRTMRGPH